MGRSRVAYPALADLADRPMRRLSVMIACALCACGSDPAEPGEETPTDPGPGTYAGPPVRCELEVMESQPPQYAVVVVVTAPTGGFELASEGAQTEGELAVVALRLTSPGGAEVVTQALEHKRVRVPLQGQPRRIEVRIAEWQRGVEYFVPPEHRLAEVLER